jgi:hypothetical protein
MIDGGVGLSLIFPPAGHPPESPANVHPEEQRSKGKTPGGKFCSGSGVKFKKMEMGHGIKGDLPHCQGEI